MKKNLILLCAVSALFACEKMGTEVETPAEAGIPVSDLVFDLSVEYTAETKATKQGWENGDAVFVFFQTISDYYLKMTYDGTKWNTVLASPGGSLPSTINTQGKTVTAVYRPFGSSDLPYYTPGGWRFATQYTYYMACEKVSHTLTKEGNKWMMTAELNMVNPDDFVQFWIEDAHAENELYYLSTDAVIPVAIAQIAPDGSVQETTHRRAGEAMMGYPYGGGYLFSGKLNKSYGGTGYYFIKDNWYDNERRDYLVTGKKLVSHSAVILPANGSSKWLQVGPTKYVELKKGKFSLGTWCTCNYGASLPEQVGTRLSFDGAVAQHAASESQFRDIMSNCSWAWTTVKGQAGMGIKADTGFLFLPVEDGWFEEYWSSDSLDDVDGWFISLIKGSSPDILPTGRNEYFAVRSVRN